MKNPPATKKKSQKSKQTSLAKRVSSRSHRSFRLTKKDRVSRAVKLPGFFTFTKEVFSTLALDKRLFLRLVAVAVVFSLLAVGAAQQSQYDNIRDSVATIIDTGVFPSGNKAVAETGTLLVAVTGGSLSAGLSESQQIYLAFIYFFVWLVVVWLLRHRLAGTAVNLRDGLYNAGSPIVATLAIVALGVLQLIPAALGAAGLSVASSSGILATGGIGVIAFTIVMVLLIILSFYWLVSTFFALIIVTLPGTYPWAAIKAANELVVGNRSKLLFRLMWLALIVILLYSLVLLPTILLNNALNISWLPLVPLVFQIVTCVALVLGSTYVYLLYRKMIDGKG